MNNEKQIAVQAKAGNLKAFQQLVEIYSHKLYAAAYRILHDQGHAEDCVQEVFVKVHQKISSFDERSKLSTWLYSITMNSAIDMQRKLARHANQDEPDLECEKDTQNQTPEQAQWIGNINLLTNKALLQLSEEVRVAFLLRHYQGETIEDISRILQVNPNTVKNRIFRAVRRLREILEPQLGTYKVDHYDTLG
ncbi:RNA polymerase sigma factor [Aliikangiella sp. IMCC44359]|uniref:RNA polymerase sigma factor n=1 Tax=Aliikangiella sp. IMCC44359 TaxID=3459125 RepID=UPI00403AE796